jgi:hypothetical protein
VQQNHRPPADRTNDLVRVCEIFAHWVLMDATATSSIDADQYHLPAERKPARRQRWCVVKRRELVGHRAQYGVAHTTIARLQPLRGARNAAIGRGPRLGRWSRGWGPGARQGRTGRGRVAGSLVLGSRRSETGLCEIGSGNLPECAAEMRPMRRGLIGDNCFAAAIMPAPVSCCVGRSADAG